MAPWPDRLHGTEEAIASPVKIVQIEPWRDDGLIAIDSNGNLWWGLFEGNQSITRLPQITWVRMVVPVE